MSRTTAWILTIILLLLGVCVACSAPDVSDDKTPVPAPAVTVAESPATPDTRTLYLSYVRETLVPQYGLSNLAAVRYLQQASEPIGMDAQCLGLMSAGMEDLDGDGLDELILAVCVERRTEYGPDHVVTVHVYTCAGGSVQRVPGPEDALVSVASDESTAYFGSEYSLQVCLGKEKLIYSCHEEEAGDTAWEEHIAYRMKDGRLQRIMDVENLLGAGEYGVVARVLPDWLNEELIGVSRRTVPYYGNESVLLYADAMSADEYYVLPGEYRVIYQTQQQAMDAVLRPMTNVPVRRMLDEHWQDQTALLAWLGEPEPTYAPPSSTDELVLLGDYILEGRNRRYAYWELDAYTKDEIALIRNGMYALSGKIFAKEENRQYFSQLDWYVPAAEDVDGLLNANQRDNLALCVQYERNHGWR